MTRENELGEPVGLHDMLMAWQGSWLPYLRVLAFKGMATLGELGKNYRSIVSGNYVLFIRYGCEDGPHSRLYIVHVVHGARDRDMYVSKRRD